MAGSKASDQPTCTAIFAGRGLLPKLLVEQLEQEKGDFFIVQMAGVDLDWVAGRKVIKARLEELGGLFATLRDLGCTDVIFAGGVDRPTLDPKKFDAGFLKVAPVLIPALGQGDEEVLKLIGKIFEDEGFPIVGAHRVIETLLAPRGVLTQSKPSKAQMTEVARAAAVVRDLGLLDLGQAAVVANGLCLAKETELGTDAMLLSLRPAAETSKEPTGVLVKAPKPQQDRRMDLPTIGPDTVRNVFAAGLAGIGIEAFGVLILNKNQTLELANKMGLFIVSYDASDFDVAQ